MATSFKVDLRRGTVVTGKWKHGRYRVERLLGEGANGKVYLVQRDRSWFALKVGSDAVDLQSEINVLQSMAKQKQQGHDSFLYDVDDLYGPDGREYPFYIMRYILGTTLADYLKRQGPEWFPLVGLNLLGKLSKLHQEGWVFGDLKVENVLVADYGHVELVDYGGVTAAGKSIRQFTEIYDRGYWNEGSRQADPRYDLFSFAVLCIQLHEPKRLHQLTKELLPQNRSADDLIRIAEANLALRPVAGWLRKAFAGQFADALEGADAWRQLMHRRDTHRTPGMPGWLKGLAAGTAVLLATSAFWLLRNMM
ncbi:protein kinase domain-containing protein [Paenibacillus arenilitoris]|uniref:non-specific serine/threonine protein kinase n=1 Tax=Paenibacillus arenilitoris TaxID=2772299 RepID=A0A927CS78_9BACL|nr:serine/threonine protein kinase [Paenibacillus arenilitoris]MBD2872652.1 serine/threonine protein kinase [Paenibacillus arenilitoris]